MKSTRFLLMICFTGIICFAAASLHAQDRRDSSREKIQNLVDNRQYTFVAQRVLPMSGRGRDLTSAYDLKVSQDTIAAFLPYFGRAYSAPTDPTQGGIKFTSTQFKYSEKTAKRGGWNITITPEDNRDVQHLTLFVSKDGYGSLQVISTHRQSISFYGYVKDNEN